MKVGDTIWKFDINRRGWGPDGRSVYRKHFEPYVIEGETPQSWLVREYRDIIRVNKKTMASAGKNGWSGHRWFTTEGMEDDIWAKDHVHRIVDEVRRAKAPELRRIAEILGLAFEEASPTASSCVAERREG